MYGVRPSVRLSVCPVDAGKQRRRATGLLLSSGNRRNLRESAVGR